MPTTHLDNASLGIDISPFLKGLHEAAAKSQATLQQIAKSPLRLSTDGKPALDTVHQLAGAWQSTQKSARSSVSEMKGALAALHASGDRSSLAVKGLTNDLRHATAEANKLARAQSEVDRKFSVGGGPGHSLVNDLSAKLPGMGG